MKYALHFMGRAGQAMLNNHSIVKGIVDLWMSRNAKTGKA